MARAAQTECAFLRRFYRFSFFFKLTEMFESSHHLILQTSPTALDRAVSHTGYVYKHTHLFLLFHVFFLKLLTLCLCSRPSYTIGYKYTFLFSTCTFETLKVYIS